jgi:hypothetical protein
MGAAPIKIGSVDQVERPVQKVQSPFPTVNYRNGKIATLPPSLNAWTGTAWTRGTNLVRNSGTWRA